MTVTYRHSDLIACARDLFGKAGLEAPIARTVAEILVEADLLGYTTHGLQFVPAYLAGIEAGTTATHGEPEVLKDGGHMLLVDGRSLPGQWVTVWTLERMVERVAQHGLVAACIHSTQNIGCLAAYIKRAADRGLLALLMASAPGSAVVAPHGGRAARFSTNPIAVGVPTDDGPILIDTSSAASSNGQVARYRRAGTRLPRPTLVSAEGFASDDPEVLFGNPSGAILPGGGLDYGHKGFAMALMVEALTSGLAGGGRSLAESERKSGNAVYLQLIDPDAFGGGEALRHETGSLAAACRDTPPLSGGPPVRMPGDRARALYARQLREGVALHPEIMPRMEPLLRKYQVPPPEPIA